MHEYAVTDLNRVNRRSERAQYENSSVYAIIDEALNCNVSFVQDGQPIIIPMIHARFHDTLVYPWRQKESVAEESGMWHLALCIGDAS